MPTSQQAHEYTVEVLKGALMRAHHLDTDQMEETNAKRDVGAQTPPLPETPVTEPGGPMTFKEALEASMKKFDGALHRLAK